MAYDPTIFNVDPYFDDYSDEKRFLRTLFRPGYAVQARELTQLQTVLQTQIQRFGDNIFKDGSIVSESQIINNTVNFVRVAGLTGYSGVTGGNFDGLTATVAGKNTIRIIDVLPPLVGSNLDVDHIFVFSQYLNGATAFAVNDTLSANFNGTTISASITGASGTNIYESPGVTGRPAFGTANLIGLDAGVRYVKGFFVSHEKQKVTPYTVTGSGSSTYRVFNDLDRTIKFNVTNRILTSTDDASLVDPAAGSPNYQAPGADRYRIDLDLTHVPYSVTADYTVLQFQGGEATYKVNYPEYNVLADTLARRTYDESGNYTVDDFQISVQDITGSEGSLDIVIGKGKAYIFGNEFINYANKVIRISKARTTTTTDAYQNIPTVIGNEIEIRFNPSLTHTNIIPSIDFNSQPWFILGATGVTCDRIGQVRIGLLELDATPKVAHLYDVTMDTGKVFGASTKLFYPGFTAANQHVFEFVAPLSGITASIQKANYTSLLYPVSNDISGYAVTNIGKQQYIIQKSCTGTIPTLSVNQNAYIVAQTPPTIHFNFPVGTNYAEFVNASSFKFISATGVDLNTVGAGIVSSLVNSKQLQFQHASYTGPVTVYASIAINESSAPEYYTTKTGTKRTDTLIMKGNSSEEYAYLNGYADVYEVVAVTGQYGAGSQTAMTNLFTLDTGQKDEIYDWSRLVVKPQYKGLGITSVSATYNYYARDNAHPGAPLLVQSYGTAPSATAYAAIPVYAQQSRSGKPVSLAGCFDFRPSRKRPSGGLTYGDDATSYAVNPIGILDDVSIDTQWTYYFPRTDKIILSKDKEFRIVTGSKSDQAPIPPDRDDAMTLGTIFLNPFTKTAKDTTRYLAKNTRYTMKDIGKLNKRIDRLEYYTTLSLSEKDAKNLEIQNAAGLNKFKNGIFVDDFNSRSNSNYNSYDHRSAIDPELKEVRPRFATRYMDFAIDASAIIASSSITMSSEGIVTLKYATDTLVRQGLAAKAVNINPFDVSNYSGTLQLTPASDDWMDTTTRPDLVVNFDGQNDGIADGETVDFGNVWNNWETNWTGIPVGITPWSAARRLAPAHSLQAPDGVWRTQVETQRQAIQETSQTRTGERIQISPETVTRNIGDRIVDISVIPYMRAATIDVKAYGMRPNVRVYPFFDGIDVSSYCTHNGNAAPFYTDSEGRLGTTALPFVFNLPGGVFRTGEKVFRLVDSSSNDVSSCSTSADQTYRSQGLLKTEEATILSTRNLTIRRESVTEERVFNNLITESSVRWYDPVAQSFFIDPISHPHGIFVKSIKVYFKTKSSTLPVNLQLRPTVNGYPSSSTIIPFSDVYKSPSDVNISDDGTAETEFVFTTPVYLLPGEYALTLISNSNEYEVWVSEVGQPDVVSGETITSQPYAGSFFKSQNSSTWTAEQSLDLKFEITKCVFETPKDVIPFTYSPDAGTNPVAAYTDMTDGINVFKINSTYITPPNTTVTATVQLPSGNVYIQNNQNVYLPSKVNVAGETLVLKYEFGLVDSTLTDVSPILDIQRVSGIYVQNILRQVSSDTVKNPIEILPTVRGITSTDQALVRYVTKKVNLQEGFESEAVDVYLSARLPVNSDIRAYMKSQSPTDNTNFDNLPYEPLQIHPNYAISYGSATGSARYVSNNVDDYVDLRFTRGGTGVANTSGVTGQTEFKSFQVKIVMYGDADNTIVPAVKDLKVIAT